MKVLRNVLLLFLIFLLGAAGCTASAQVYLQMEKRASARTTKFQPGDVLTWRMHGNKSWHQSELIRLIPEDSIVVFADGYVSLGQIAAIRSFAGTRWSKPLAYQLYLFGASWNGYALIAALLDETDPYTRGDLLVTLSASGAGLLIHQLFKHRTFRMGKRWRLRIVDLRVRRSSAPPR